MTDTRFVCSVCRSVFSEYQSSVNPVDQDQVRCPDCGSALVEPDHFDPNEPVEDLLEEPEQEGYAS